ncbi:2-amino-4-hydroxy-6-hydroxymethyldihydropteridine diphosphokinase [Microbulbifer spongiae]|uniref:2-amino-4-hydroxy-6-hydroxymethyldihydropteridine pyrophosphokinase n=1 Tax=Microbulbifer spongiae TaxID=2944933 RepID=A0ABY9E9U6_9GAMM|nr:2-amino-4-hydroxy-6-hydroxymethyldihydropteridine diphosphokinase [Microbulbifer sp. MI-G]WKD48858.1 2-amino-4-hydroxy-6-hydroxymethyldihydropteridine diphosphokinase [Microbulbifer sp. MI-G]
MDTVYLGLGSNLAQPRKQLRNALVALADMPQSQLLRCSGFYRSAPLVQAGNRITSMRSQNCAQGSAPFTTRPTAGHRGDPRARAFPALGARTLDLDILLFGEQHIDSLRLQVPHPRMFERNFVLVPLAELSPNLRLPTGETLAQLLQYCPHNRLQKI